MQFERLVFLDKDVHVVRNIDVLASAPTPSFTFHRADNGWAQFWRVRTSKLERAVVVAAVLANPALIP